MQDFFSYYIRQQTILADVTVGCQSNSRRVSSISDLLSPAAKAATAGPPTPTSRGRLCCRAGLSAPYYSHRWPGHPSTHPHPLLFCGDGSLTPQRTSELLYSSTRGHPLPRIPRIRVVPRLSCLRPTTWPSNRSYGPSSSPRHPRPSRGSKPREADDARPPLE